MFSLFLLDIDNYFGRLANRFLYRWHLGRKINQVCQLYCDMIDSKKISIMDARYILPRCLETFYYMRLSLKDAIHFIRQRIDKQIQPETDNIIAYQMYLEILRQFPYANGIVDIHAPSQFYINTARTGKATNLYFPDEDSDKFEKLIDEQEFENTFEMPYLYWKIEVEQNENNTL